MSVARRSGIAAVELAVSAPVLTLMIFGSIQACEAIYLRHTAVTAAYEGSLELARPDSTTAAVEARIEQVLLLRDAKKASHAIDSGGIDVRNLSPGDPVTIRVAIPIADNVPFSGFFPLPVSATYTLTCTR
ncbi:MAG: TadE family protein [Planctomycetota bacterium]